MCQVYDLSRSSALENRIKTFCETNLISLDRNSDIVRIGKNLGFDIFKLPLDKEKVDGVILVDKTERLIGVNKSLELQDTRFVIAHEIAHFITQKQKAESGQSPFFAMRDKIFHGEEKSEEENDMDYMAAAILVPKDVFSNDLKSLKINPCDIVDHSEKTVKEKISNILIKFLAQLYNVRERVIVRRIAELSYYAE